MSEPELTLVLKIVKEMQGEMRQMRDLQTDTRLIRSTMATKGDIADVSGRIDGIYRYLDYIHGATNVQSDRMEQLEARVTALEDRREG